MISPQDLFNCFSGHGISFFTGVPDSLLKDFGGFLATQPAENHVISANEGGAVGLAIGYHLATGNTPVVYMQNSGLGNSVNPLLSLADRRVYSVPMILLIGWRGEPGTKDEPQHMSQGEATTAILDAVGIPWRTLGISAKDAIKAVDWASSTAEACSKPVAILVSKGAFQKALLRVETEELWREGLSREAAIEAVVESLKSDDIIVSSTGMISRELYEISSKLADREWPKFFMAIGGMGHASQIALGLSMHSSKRILCLDGDGAALMHMGGLATIGVTRGLDLVHVVLNNGVHDSVGGQPTAAAEMSLTKVAESCGYDLVSPKAKTELELRDGLALALDGDGSRFLEVQVRPGHRADLGRPTETPLQRKASVIETFSSASVRVGNVSNQSAHN